MSFVDAPFDAFAEKTGAPSGGAKRPYGSEAGSDKQKRVKLKAYDAVAAQLLNPYGPSMEKNMSLKELWHAVTEGNNAATFHSELAATELTGGVYRVGVGISRVAESLIAAIHALEEPMLKRLLRDAPLAAALNEGKQLEKSLVILNAGKGSERTGEELAGFGKFRAAAAQPEAPPQQSETAVKRAAAELHAWLSLEKSPLRAVLALMSGHGVFYAAQVNEKVARGWIHHKPATLADVEAAALARRGQGAGASSSSGGAAMENDAAGLV